MPRCLSAERGEGYVSLMIGAVNFTLPDIHEHQWSEAAAAFPNHAATLLAYDIFIGNIDRANNLKVDMRRRSLNFFAGFDHSHCLLDIHTEAQESLAELSSDGLIVTGYPFYQAPAIRMERVANYVERIEELPDSLILTTCMILLLARVPGRSRQPSDVHPSSTTTYSYGMIVVDDRPDTKKAFLRKRG